MQSGGGIGFCEEQNLKSELEVFSAVVEKIYDAAADTMLWSSALENIVSYVGVSASTLAFGNTNVIEQDPSSLHSYGLSPEILQHYGQYAGVWALQSGIAMWDVGRVYSLPELMSREEFENGLFYRAVLAPFKEHDFMGIVTLKQGPHVVAMTATTRTELGLIQENQISKLKRLAPHICKASKISFALELKSLKIQMLESSLDKLNVGIFILTKDNMPIFLNNRAEQILKQGRSFKLNKNRLEMMNHDTNTEFEKNLASIRNGKKEFNFPSTSFALPDEAGGMIATMLPLNSDLRQNIMSGLGEDGYAIFVQDPMAPPPVPGEGFAKLYGVTQGELRTLMAMSMSQGPQDAANILGVSISTIRTHLKHVFAKTNTTSQSELMQLVMRSAAPLAVN
jgi:DNA-binding CsgD family transcriptional regulator/PAS domain-containing protein